MNSIIENLDLSITECDIAEMMPEINRFLLHIFIVHIVTYIIDGKEIFTLSIFKTLFITAVAIIIYHIVLKKSLNRKLKNIKHICNKHKDY